jgi:hypothetical protein
MQIVNLNVDVIQNALLPLKQESCQLFHIFGAGIYIRELHMKAGTFAIGHFQKQKHNNIMLKGKVALLGDNNLVNVIEAPFFSVGNSGRKMGYVLEDTIWQNIYATEETDIEKLESMFLEKSPDYIEHQEREFSFLKAINQWVRDDYSLFLSENGIDEILVRKQSEDICDLIEMPREYMSFYSIRRSPIEGLGVFSSHDIKAGTLIAPARIGSFRTPLGRYLNHSPHENSRFVMKKNAVYLQATRDILGCQGGDHGEELTVNYRDVLNFHRENLCLA